MRVNDNTTRRTLIMGAGASGLAVTLAACGGSAEEPTAAQPTEAEPAASAEQPAPSASAEQSGKTGAALAATADIPVGGGAVFKDQKVVVVQPSAGEFKAFTAVCTHRGCSVEEVKDGSIICPCHMSKFSTSDGSVQGGPAKAPLAEVKISVSGDQIALA
ncbi:Rieske (2Fe-2S) protein [Streptosporangium sp. KLBMP 9127]|nr:Rieske (2Fe-2S) protein [Streptosporangium sp. KLBMP 9127]